MSGVPGRPVEFGNGEFRYALLRRLMVSGVNLRC